MRADQIIGVVTLPTGLPSQYAILVNSTMTHFYLSHSLDSLFVCLLISVMRPNAANLLME
jgi:hypothetical protein